MADAVPASVAVLDRTGTIVCVNREWLRFGQAGGLRAGSGGVGSNYLAACARAGEDCAEAVAAAAGIRAVLEGAQRQFMLEYPCDTPGARRRFLMLVTPLDPSSLGGAVVMHVEVTERDVAEWKERHERALEASGQILYDWDPVTDVVHSGGAYARILGYTAAEMPRTLQGWIDRIHPDDRRTFGAEVARCVAARLPFSQEYRVRRQDGSYIVVRDEGRIISDAGGVVVRIAGLITDITERRRAEEDRDRFFALSTDLLCVSTLDCRPLRVNPAWERVFGWTEEEIRGVSILEHTHPEDRAAIARTMQGLAEGKTVSAEVRTECKDGSYRWIEWHATPALDRGVLYAVGRDVTERKTAEMAREAERRRAGVLARVGQELISSVDTPVLLDRLCQLTTETLAADLSATWLWDAAEGVFHPVAAHGIPPEEWDSLRAMVWPRGPFIAQLERAGVLELRLGQRSGPLVEALMVHAGYHALLAVALRRGEQLAGVHAIALRTPQAEFTEEQRQLARGVGALASLALANAKLVEELERASRLKTEFVSTMSHELRTPLNVMLGYIDMLADDGEPIERARALVQLRKSSLELLELIESTLDLGRITTGRDVPCLEPLHLGHLWAELAGEFAVLPCKRDVALCCDPAPEVTVRTDRRKIRIILKNLIGNALKFTDAGTITARCQQSGDRIILTVRDTGIGIEPDSLQVIFDMFRQVDGSDARRHGGVGLGLYIVRTLVTQLGGTVEVESVPGAGSTFRVVLPARP